MTYPDIHGNARIPDIFSIPESIFEFVVRQVLADGGLVVSFAGVYIDESNSHAGAPALSVAGYMYGVMDAIAGDREWRAILAEKNVPYCRMSEFKDGRGVFSHLSQEEIRATQIRLIDVVQRHRLTGFISAVNEKEFDDHFRSVVVPPELKDERTFTPYSFCLLDCLRMVAKYCNHIGFNGKIAYFFESGHEHQGYADQLIEELLKRPGLSQFLRYDGHRFIKKESSGLLQASDMLAYLSANWVARIRAKNVSGKTESEALMRKDLYAMLGTVPGKAPLQRNSIHYWSPKNMKALLPPMSYFREISSGKKPF